MEIHEFSMWDCPIVVLSFLYLHCMVLAFLLGPKNSPPSSHVTCLRQLLHLSHDTAPWKLRVIKHLGVSENGIYLDITPIFWASTVSGEHDDPLLDFFKGTLFSNKLSLIWKMNS